MSVFIVGGKQPTAAKTPASSLLLPSQFRIPENRTAHGSLGPSQTSVVEPFYRPYLQRTDVELPKTLKEKVYYRRYFYAHEPIVSSAVDLHSLFPLSTFWLEHPDKTLMADFDRLADKLELFEFLLELLHEYYINGEAFPFLFVDNVEQPQTWTGVTLLDPAYINVQWDPLITGNRSSKISLQPSPLITHIVQDGPNSPETGDLYAQIPPELIAAVHDGEGVILNNLQVGHIKRHGNFFDPRGTSMIDACFKLLAYKDKLRSAQWAIADRHVTPREFYSLGTETAPADNDELEEFRQLLAGQWSSPNSAIVWHHAVKVDWQGASGKILPLGPEFQYVDKQLAIALMINEGILTAERQPYASTSVALDVMIQRYLSIRMRVENWVENKVFKPLCKIHKIYKRTTGELQHRIRFTKEEQDLDIPKVRWDKEDLKNDLQKYAQILGLATAGKVSWSTTLKYLDLNLKEESKKIREEAKLMVPVPGAPGAPGAGGGDMGPGGLPDSPMEPGGGPAEDFGEGALPSEFGGEEGAGGAEEGGFGQATPPESNETPGLATAV